MGVLVRTCSRLASLDEVRRSAGTSRSAWLALATRRPSTTPAPSIHPHHRPARGRPARVGDATSAPGARQPPDQRARAHARWVADRGRSTHGRDAVIEVRDHGPGRPQRPDASELFERFWRAEAGPHPRPRGGAGLGMAIVDGDVDAHGGQVTRRTRRRAGASFSSCALTA